MGDFNLAARLDAACPGFGGPSAPYASMSRKTFVPFGGIHGWIADLTVPGSKRTASLVKSYFVAETEEWRALAAVRIHAGVKNDADLASRRALSMREVQRLGMKPGQVISA